MSRIKENYEDKIYEYRSGWQRGKNSFNRLISDST